MCSLSDALIAARNEIANIESTVRIDLAGNESLQGLPITEVFHYVVYGAHVDPDLGRDYVPVDEPVNSYRRRKIVKRNAKVDTLVDWLEASIVAGRPALDVQRELATRQTFPTVVLALSSAELEALLTEAFAEDYCMPGLDGGYFDLIGTTGLLYGWKEAIACMGGITDRYSDAELQREYDRKGKTKSDN